VTPPGAHTPEKEPLADDATAECKHMVRYCQDDSTRGLGATPARALFAADPGATGLAVGSRRTGEQIIDFLLETYVAYMRSTGDRSQNNSMSCCRYD